jgi:hypothetical protein
MARYRVVASVVFMAVAAAASIGNAAPAASGTAEKVTQSAQAAGTGGARALEENGAVFQGDDIRTDRSGEAQIRFVDNTRVVVGPGAHLTIDAFVFSGKTAKTVTLSAVRGAFRFITGSSRKQAYLIRTPVVAVGVRGTGLDGFVEPGTGRTTIAVYEGAVQLCDANGQCRDFGKTCDITISRGGGFQEPTPGSRALSFPYAGSQSSLLPDFRLDVSACRTNPAPFRDPMETHGDRSTGGAGSESNGGTDSGGDGGTAGKR